MLDTRKEKRMTQATQGYNPAHQKTLEERIKNDFTYHTPPKEKQQVFVSLREKAKELALMIAAEVPTGREQSSALTNLEQVIFHANAGIARQYPADAIPKPGAA
jgi:hypothetical protein